MLGLLGNITALGNTAHICDCYSAGALATAIGIHFHAKSFLEMAFRVHICQPSMFSSGSAVAAYALGSQFGQPLVFTRGSTLSSIARLNSLTLSS